jgi:hypothetical protein
MVSAADLQNESEAAAAAAKTVLDNENYAQVRANTLGLAELQRTQRKEREEKTRTCSQWRGLLASCWNLSLCGGKSVQPVMTVTGDTPHLGFAAATSQGSRR